VGPNSDSSHPARNPLPHGARRSCSTDGQPAPASRSVTSNSFRCPAGTEQTCKSRGSHGRGLLLLDEQPLAFEEILERAGALSKNTVRRRLGELVQQGLAERLSDGKRSDPYRWKLSEAGRTFLPTSENGLARNAGDPPVQAENFFPSQPSPRGEGGWEETSTLACELHPGEHAVSKRAAGYVFLACGCAQLEAGGA
jgi:DNA-binding HxlR family transcriptional regulator